MAMFLESALKMKKSLLLAMTAMAFLFALGCEEAEEVNREFSLDEVFIMSKQWCATTPLFYGPPLNANIESVVKLDLTQVGYIYVNTITKSGFANPPRTQQNILSCSITANVNEMDCYGLDTIQFKLNRSTNTMSVNLIEEVKEFKECEMEELQLFK